METTPWLTILGAIPLVGAGVVSLMPRSAAKSARLVGLAVSLVTLVVGVYLAWFFDVARSGQQQFTEVHSWIPAFGVSYALGVNGIGLTMVLLSVILVPICLLGLWDTVAESSPRAAVRMKNFVALILVLETMMIGVFAARDVFLFYVFFEAMLIPTYFLIAGYGGQRAGRAAMKFLLYSLAGGLIMLVGVVAVFMYGPGGERGFLIDELARAQYPSDTVERLLFLSFFIAFAVKAPMWPVHTWLPDAAEEAPPGVSVLLVGVLDKVGTFGMMTLCLVLFPRASAWAAPSVIVLALVSIIAGGLAAIGSRNIHRLIAYTSVSHFGFIVLGIFAMTTIGQAGSMLYMVNHGFSTAALFLIAGMLAHRTGSADMHAFGGFQRVTPWLAGTFLFAGLSSLALPGLSSFVSEFLVLQGTFQRHPWAAAIAVLGVVLSAMYILITYKRMMTGPAAEGVTHHDMVRREGLVVAPLVAIILAMGFFPQPVLDVINPAVQATMAGIGMTDPAPVADGGTNR